MSRPARIRAAVVAAAALFSLPACGRRAGGPTEPLPTAPNVAVQTQERPAPTPKGPEVDVALAFVQDVQAQQYSAAPTVDLRVISQRR